MKRKQTDAEVENSQHTNIWTGIHFECTWQVLGSQLFSFY